MRVKTKAQDVAKIRASRDEDASQDENAVQIETDSLIGALESGRF